MAAPLDRVKALLAALPADDQKELRRYLSDILVTPDEAESIQLASLQETRAGKRVTYTFRQEHVRCGKPACWCYESALGHGPYTYKYWRDPSTGKLKKSYVKRPVDAARGVRRRAGSAANSSSPSPRA